MVIFECKRLLAAQMGEMIPNCAGLVTGLQNRTPAYSQSCVQITGVAVNQ